LAEHHTYHHQAESRPEEPREGNYHRHRRDQRTGLLSVWLSLLVSGSQAACAVVL